MARDRPLKVVVDTNVIAYYLLATAPFVEEVRTFWRRPLDLAAPALWEAEVSNVLWMAARTRVIDESMALHRLGLAARLGIRSVPTRSMRRQHARTVTTGEPATRSRRTEDFVTTITLSKSDAAGVKTDAVVIGVVKLGGAVTLRAAAAAASAGGADRRREGDRQPPGRCGGRRCDRRREDAHDAIIMGIAGVGRSR